MADNDWFDNQHSGVDHSAATHIRQRRNDSSMYDGSFANTTAQMGDSSHTHPSSTRYQTTDGPPAANIGPHTQQPSLFQGAHHFGIDRATFNITSAPSPAIDPYSILHNAIAIEATHVSKTASYAPKCNPQTRIQIVSDIVALVKEGLKPMIWFSGPAGGGKTCIMRTVVERCQQDGLWTCSYFFSTRIAGLDNVDPFVATIANQLMTVLPALKPPTLNAISGHPTVFRQSLDSQVDKLIVQPLIATRSGLPPSTTPSQVVIAIDGFDECRNEDERIHLLRVLGSLHSRLPASIVVSIIVASRPELDIRMAFDDPQLGEITQSVLLQRYNGMTDVAIYWHDELEKIRQKHPMRRLIPEDWPVEKILRTLIHMSSGQFILPSIIIKHISNPRYNPVERLKQVLNPSPSSGLKHPLTELDALYTVILHPPEGDFQLMKRILYCIIGMSAVGAGYPCTPSLLDDLLQLSPGSVEAVLSDLHSVLDVPSDNSEHSYITFHHKTLEDFLLSSDRAKDLYQAPHETHADLTLACIRRLKVWAANPLVSHRRPWNYDALFYTRKCWDDHFIKSFEGSPSAASVSDILLEFDPRIVTRSVYTLSDGMDFEYHIGRLSIIFDAFHTAMCPAELCLPLCRLLHHRCRCHDKLASFQRNMAWTGGYQGMFGLLPRFDVETGLYGEDEVNTLLYPVGHQLLAIELESIRQTHPLLVRRDNWPVEDILSTLMAQFPGNLLIPSIIIRYINDPDHSPAVMLDKALAACASATAGEQAKLDSLYTLILHPPDIDIPLMKSMLHMIIELSSLNIEHKCVDVQATPSLLEGYLQLPSGAVSATLCHLYSIVYIPTNTTWRLTIYHKSLEDYLLSPHRSLDLFQEPYQTRINLTLACTRHLQRWAATPGIVDKCIRHATWLWDTLLAGCFNNELSPSSIELLEPVLKFDPRIFWRLWFLIHHPVYALQPVSQLCEMIHSTMCTGNQSCLLLCRLLRRMDKCYREVDAIYDSFPGFSSKDKEDRLAALHRFDIETGLYDEAEVEGFTYPKNLIWI